MASSLVFYPKLFAFIDGVFLTENCRVVTWVEPRSRMVEFGDAVPDEDAGYPFTHNDVARMVDEEREHDVVLIIGNGRALAATETVEHFLAQPCTRPDRVCRLKGRFVHTEMRASVNTFVEHVFRLRGARTAFV